jgi:hypothetical protein
MAVEPGYGMAPLGYGQMRAAQADRERAIDVLKAAFAEGRLDQDEYAGRVGQVYASRTYGELSALTADLPVGPLGTLPQQAAPPAPYLLPPYQPVPLRSRPNPLLTPLLVIILLLGLAAGAGIAATAFPIVLVILLFSLIRRSRR